MNTVREIQQMNQRELELGITYEDSWHYEYRNSAYIFVGGLDVTLTEDDIIKIFSQFGEIVDLNICRDKKTDRPLGFVFLAYEDQRSTVLAVDNFNGVTINGRTLRVDHAGRYRPPKKKENPDDGERYDSDDDYEERRRRIWDFEAYGYNDMLRMTEKAMALLQDKGIHSDKGPSRAKNDSTSLSSSSSSLSNASKKSSLSSSSSSHKDYAARERGEVDSRRYSSNEHNSRSRSEFKDDRYSENRHSEVVAVLNAEDLEDPSILDQLDDTNGSGDERMVGHKQRSSEAAAAARAALAAKYGHSTTTSATANPVPSNNGASAPRKSRWEKR